jgi:hypothetical protein
VSKLWTILRTLFGLFIDDGSLAVGALLWLGACALLFPGTIWGGPALFLGLALLLGENTRRAAARRRCD